MPAVKQVTLIFAKAIVLKIKNAVNLSAWSVQEYMATADQWGTLHDLVPFVQFKKREKHPWRSANFSKVLFIYLFIYLFYSLYLPSIYNSSNIY